MELSIIKVKLDHRFEKKIEPFFFSPEFLMLIFDVKNGFRKLRGF